MAFLHDRGPTSFWHLFVTADLGIFGIFFVTADLRGFGIFCDRRLESFSHFCVTVDLRVFGSFSRMRTGKFVVFFTKLLN